MMWGACQTALSSVGEFLVLPCRWENQSSQTEAKWPSETSALWSGRASLGNQVSVQLQSKIHVNSSHNVTRVWKCAVTFFTHFSYLDINGVTTWVFFHWSDYDKNSQTAREQNLFIVKTYKTLIININHIHSKVLTNPTATELHVLHWYTLRQWLWTLKKITILYRISLYFISIIQNFLSIKNHNGQLHGRVKHLCNGRSQAVLNNFKHHSWIVSTHKTLFLA